jgi:hypothetical protein
MASNSSPSGHRHRIFCAPAFIGVLLSLALAAGFLLVSGVSADNQDGSGFNLKIQVTENQTGAAVAQALVYIDGTAKGQTSDADGSLLIPAIPRGQHSVRVTKPGYGDVTDIVDVQGDTSAAVTLSPSTITPVLVNGPPEGKINVVFVPSNTEYNGDTNQKLPADKYASRTAFEYDVKNLIANYLRLDSITSSSVGIPADYQNRINYYYYWDGTHFADAFDGCAGTLPDHFWEDAPFTDAAIIVYPEYVGTYRGPPSEPTGCGVGLGLGTHSWAKVPATSKTIFLHESGHAIWGLVDTFCGATDYYTEIDPDPNIWTSEAACKQSAETNHWNTSYCRQITGPACSVQFWRYDPEPDLMGLGANSYFGVFGDASTTRIRYLLDNIAAVKKT